MQANNLNTEILLNLSPINVISDAIKRFGISEECSNTIVIKIMIDSPVDTGEFEQKVDDIIHGNSIKIDDNTLFNLVDISKFKKIYKLNDAKISNSNDKDLQGTLTRLAIGASIIRGL
ncbi:CGI121 [Candida pseudojiufengensis]|uniref:CGI121 n=1 Tax=Candida pseudojiufengensis TaxID=497109 RepID=UPI002225046B|nr:CGI121 [Candida pseudojiufengensis]KAI5964180.1 CGI121 [Candida pseudojiufengensis]